MASSAPKAPPPWEQSTQAAAPQPAAYAPPAPQQPPLQQPPLPQPQYEEDDDGPPSWVTEFSDDTAVAQEAPAAMVANAAPATSVAPVAQRAAAAPKPAYVITPVAEIDWDGNWPGLAACLNLRGVAQQLAFQTELVSCAVDGNVTTFRLRVPIDTLRASGNTDKLCACLQERFAGTKVHVEIDIGQVWYTASAEAQAYREQCQRAAEETVGTDPFVQSLMRDMNAFVVQGSIRPAATA